MEEILGCDLTDRKKEIDGLVMDFINNQSSDEDDDSEDERELQKRRSAAKKSASKRKSAQDSDDDDSDESESDDDYKPKKAAKAAKKKKRGSDSDSDGDWKKSKSSSAKKAKKSGGGGGKGFTRPLKLSPELSSLMGGAESLPRHEVVKKVWALIKERNLYDPKNKQFAICDADLQKVIGVKRFRTFGMMKYLQPHFLG